MITCQSNCTWYHNNTWTWTNVIMFDPVYFYLIWPSQLTYVCCPNNDIYLHGRKLYRTENPSKILTHLCFALVGVLVLFIVGTQSFVRSHTLACKVGARHNLDTFVLTFETLACWWKEFWLCLLWLCLFTSRVVVHGRSVWVAVLWSVCLLQKLWLLKVMLVFSVFNTKWTSSTNELAE